MTSKSHWNALPLSSEKKAAAADHRAVVCAQAGAGDDYLDGRDFGHLLAQMRVGGYSTAQDDAVDAVFLYSVHRSAHHRINYGLLEGVGDLGDLG